MVFIIKIVLHLKQYCKPCKDTAEIQQKYKVVKCNHFALVFVGEYVIDAKWYLFTSKVFSFKSTLIKAPYKLFIMAPELKLIAHYKKSIHASIRTTTF